MTLEEAEAIAGIISSADSYCSYCATDLMEKCKEEWPQFHWEYDHEDGVVVKEKHD